VSEAQVLIGSRGSSLAMAQATLVRDAFNEAGHPSSIVVIETAGDRRAPDTAWGEGAFVAAIELALLDGRVDVAVHSAKDIPTEEDPRLLIAAYLPRADARDALVVGPGVRGSGLDDLPPGARIGTDSPRRTGFVRARRRDLVVRPLHGNVDTRLRRLDAGEVDALVLACAGLDRLGLSHRIAMRFEADLLPPAPGQGAIAIQVRADDARMGALATEVDHLPTRIAVSAERAFLRATGGGCRAPIGAYATVTDDDVDVLGGVVSPDGSSVQFARAHGSVGRADSVGRGLADRFAGRERRAAMEDASRPRVLVTRPAAQAATFIEALRGARLEPVLVPAIEIQLLPEAAGLQQAVGRIDDFQWVVVTSANGAQAILDAAFRAKANLGNPRWAALGAATGAVLRAAGIGIAFEPASSTADALAAGIPLVAGDQVAVIRGDLAGNVLATRLRARGATVDDIVGYRTREAPDSSRALLRDAIDAGPISALVFSSGSTVRGLTRLVAAESIDLSGIPAICIGDATAEAARLAGFRVMAIAPSPDAITVAETTALALEVQPAEVT